MSAPLPLRLRAGAGLIALCGLAGLLVQLYSSTVYEESFVSAVWGMGRYYTNIGNGLIAFCLFGLALARSWAMRPLVIGGATINAWLIGLVYAILLGHGLHGGESWLAMVLLHRVVPPLLAIFWLTMVPRGGLKWRDPLLWAAPPILYFAYVMIRGLIDGRFPYFFIDAAHIGWLATFRNAAVMTLLFLALGWAMVGIDRMFAPSRPRAEN